MYLTIKEASIKYSISGTSLCKWRNNGHVRSMIKPVVFNRYQGDKIIRVHRDLIFLNEDDIARTVKKSSSQPTKKWILEMLAQGKTQKQMAKASLISEDKLKRHMVRLKIQSRTRTQAAHLASHHNRVHPVDVQHRGEAPKRKAVFRRILKWVDSLDKMPTRKEIEAQSDRRFMHPVDIESLIETRPYRKLSKLKEMSWKIAKL